MDRRTDRSRSCGDFVAHQPFHGVASSDDSNRYVPNKLGSLFVFSGWVFLPQVERFRYLGGLFTNDQCVRVTEGLE